MNVTFTYNSGRERRMSRAEAEVLQLLGHGRYEAPDASAPSSEHALPATSASIAQEPDKSLGCDVSASSSSGPMDELDSLDSAALQALAKERGVKVHHNAGADKVRAALRQAAQAY